MAVAVADGRGALLRVRRRRRPRLERTRKRRRVALQVSNLHDLISQTVFPNLEHGSMDVTVRYNAIHLRPISQRFCETSHKIFAKWASYKADFSLAQQDLSRRFPSACGYPAISKVGVHQKCSDLASHMHHVPNGRESRLDVLALYYSMHVSQEEGRSCRKVLQLPFYFLAVSCSACRFPRRS